MKICGMDECGRGAFAGPLVAAAVVIESDIEKFPELLQLPLRDSKLLTEIQRNKIYSIRHKLPIKFKIEEISVEEINKNGMGWANREIFLRLTQRLKAHVYIVDGNLKFPDNHFQSLIKGDNKCYQVMLASILAKVYRDKLLKKLHKQYKLYGWDKNSGYGTKEHRQAIKVYGQTPLHRQQYIATYLKHESEKVTL